MTCYRYRHVSLRVAQMKVKTVLGPKRETRRCQVVPPDIPEDPLSGMQNGIP